MNEKYITKDSHSSLFEQMKIEIEKAKELFMEADLRLERALIIQWLINEHGGGAGDFELSDTVEEMTETLEYFSSLLGNKGTPSYQSELKALFFNHVEIEFCAEANSKPFKKPTEPAKE